MRRYFLLIIGFVLAVFQSCTLEMEEYIVTEENKGVDEVCTEVTPVGNITYKYNSDVTPLNGVIQNYVVMSEDSVLYLSDNIPSKYIPEVGGYVAANCSERLPLGISGRVVSVTRANGMIRVEHVPAQREEVFEVFQANIDFELAMPSVESYDSLEYAENGMMLNDSTYIDMSLFERLDTLNATRGAQDKDTTFMLNMSHQFNEFTGSMSKLNGLYLEMTFTSKDVKKIHFYEDTEKRIREEWSDTYSERQLQFICGFGSDSKSVRSAFNKKTTPNSVQDYLNLYKSGKTLLEMTDSDVYKKLWKKAKKQISGKVIIFPLTGTPLSVMIDFDADAYLQIMGYVDASYTWRTATRRVGMVIKDEKKTRIDKEIKPAGDSDFDLKLGGKFDFNFRVRGGLGIMVGNNIGGIGMVVGLELKAGLMAQYVVEPLTDNPQFTIIDYENFKITPYYSYGGYGKGVGTFLGIQFEAGDFNFMTHTKTYPLNLNAEIDKHKATYTYVEDPVTGRMRPKITSTFTFSRLPTILYCPFSKNDDQRACVRVYPGNLSSKDFVEVYSEDLVMSVGTEYKVEIDAVKENLKEATTYHIVPCMYDKGAGMLTEFRNKVVVLGDATPQMDNPMIYQWYGLDMTEENFDGYKENNFLLSEYEYTDFAEYAFTSVVKLSNVLNVKKWGFNYKVYSGSGKMLIDEDVYINDGSKAVVAGTYSVVSSFYINDKPKSKSDYLCVKIQPFCEYDTGGAKLEKKYYATKGPTPLSYPYEREGGVYTVGKSEFVFLNDYE